MYAARAPIFAIVFSFKKIMQIKQMKEDIALLIGTLITISKEKIDKLK